MIKRILAVVLCTMMLSAGTMAFAENVFVTKNGSKYHKADCRFVKNREVEEISKEAAIEEGLTPCSRCYKEDVAVMQTKEEEAKTLSKK